ncbi:MAG: site-2 protease family protein [Candidatus Paceibacterota bacterium]
MGIETTILFIAVLIISVVVHEVAHGYTAYYLGDPTAKLAGRLTMNPIPHIDPIGSILVPAALALLPGNIVFGWAKPVPYNPHNIANRYGDALVAAAGPLSNFFLAGIAGAILQLTAVTAASALGTFLVGIILINIVLAVFNLVPIPPLDGSKILFNFLPPRFNYIRDTLEQYGFMILLLFIFFAIELIQPIIFTLFELFAGVGIGVL